MGYIPLLGLYMGNYTTPQFTGDILGIVSKIKLHPFLIKNNKGIIIIIVILKIIF